MYHVPIHALLIRWDIAFIPHFPDSLSLHCLPGKTTLGANFNIS